MNILLDYFFPITAISPIPAASTAFLKQVCVVVSPKDGGVTAGVLHLCTTSAQIAALTNNTEALQLLSGGLSRVYILPMNDLDLSTALVGHESDFFTVLISSDFNDAAIVATQATGNITITSYANLVSGTHDTVTVAGVVFTAQSGAATLGTATFQAATSNDATAASLAAQVNAHAVASLAVTALAASAVVGITANSAGSAGNAITLGYTDNDTNVGATKSGTVLSGGDGLFLGNFKGVTGVSSTDDTFLAAQAAIENRSAWHTVSANKAKNMMYAFGKLLSNFAHWNNNQFITMPFADDVDNVGKCNTLFDAKINFVLSDDEFGIRLGLFAVGGKAIISPYVIKNIEIDIQSGALTWVSANEPSYTATEGALLEDELQKVIDEYIADDEIESGSIEIKLLEDNFVGTADIVVAEPRALWRIFGQITQV